MAVVSEVRVESEIKDLTEEKPWLEVSGKLTRKYPLGAFGAVVVIVVGLVLSAGSRSAGTS